MRVRNFAELARVILDLNKHCLYYNKCWLIRNVQDLRNFFLEFSMRVRNFAGLFRVILVINKHLLYYYKCWLIRYGQDLSNVFL